MKKKLPLLDRKEIETLNVSGRSIHDLWSSEDTDSWDVFSTTSIPSYHAAYLHRGGRFPFHTIVIQQMKHLIWSNI